MKKMDHCFYAMIIFFIVIFSCWCVQWYSFTILDEEAFAKCIEDNIKIGFNRMNYSNEILRIISIRIARDLHRATDYSKDWIEKDLTEVFKLLSVQYNSVTKIIPWKKIEKAASVALLEKCSDEVFFELLNFGNEPLEEANILNYILVDWHESPYEMAQTHEGRTILRKYAKNALELLKKALCIYDQISIRTVEFRLRIRALWMHRAYRYFDSRDSEDPFVRFYFDNIAGVIYPELPRRIYERITQEVLSNEDDSWYNRNPSVSETDRHMFLNIHGMDRSSYRPESDIFIVYASRNISSAEYYLERHIDQFYRILFFIQEMEARNIEINEEEQDIVFLGPVPSFLITEEAYEILRSDNVYRDYLFRLRSTYENSSLPVRSSNQTRFRRNLAQSSRVHEEDLLGLMFTEHPRSHLLMNHPVNRENHRMAVLKFPNEIPNVASILDYILVKWRSPPEQMIRTQQGRSELRSYANQVQQLLENAFSQNYDLRFNLRDMWRSRAQLYFDVRIGRLPYLPYFYSTDVTPLKPFMVSYLYEVFFSYLVNMRYTSEGESDLIVSVQEQEKILNIHVQDRPHRGKYDPLSRYDRFFMKNSTYYFERHNDQFYRILFFFQELQARGILSDADDIYSEEIPPEVVPLQIQALVHDDNVYRDYLLRLRQIYGDDNGSLLRQRLNRTARVYEEYLMELLITEHPTSHIYYITTSTTPSTSTTTTPITSTTDEVPLDMKENKRKPHVNQSGRHFSERQGVLCSENCCFDKNFDSSNPQELKESCGEQRLDFKNKSSNIEISFQHPITNAIHKKQKIEIFQEYFIPLVQFSVEESANTIKILNVLTQMYS